MCIRDSSTSGNQMTIQQQTQKLVTQWQSFDVGAQNTVRFIQPDSNSVALNRVMGASGSQILGSLQANGKAVSYTHLDVYKRQISTAANS